MENTAQCAPPEMQHLPDHSASAAARSAALCLLSVPRPAWVLSGGGHLSHSHAFHPKTPVSWEPELLVEMGLRLPDIYEPAEAWEATSTKHNLPQSTASHQA